MKRELTKCTHCGKRLRATILTVHVADAFAREAPSGVFHVDNCFREAIAARDAVELDRRLVADVVCVRGE